MDTEHTYVATKKDVEDCVAQLEQEDIIAIDIECENNLHHYGTYTALIQISSRKQNWLIDTLALQEHKGAFAILGPIFANQNIRKVFHDVSFDIRLLHYEFGWDMYNVYDTQLAAQFLGKDKLGLSDLLEEYFSISKVKALQKADWTTRPLPQNMIAYAIMDTAYLLELYDLLTAELKALKRDVWVEEEILGFSALATQYKEPDHSSIRGYGRLAPDAQFRCSVLYNLREKLAKKLNKPNYFVMNNRILIDIAQRPLPSVRAWKGLKGVHPAVKREAEKFFSALQKQPTIHNDREHRVIKRFSEEQKQFMKRLMDKRDKICKKLDLKPHLLISKDELQQITATGSFEVLRDWQKELLSVS